MRFTEFLEEQMVVDIASKINPDIYNKYVDVFMESISRENLEALRQDLAHKPELKNDPKFMHLYNSGVRHHFVNFLLQHMKETTKYLKTNNNFIKENVYPIWIRTMKAMFQELRAKTDAQSNNI